MSLVKLIKFKSLGDARGELVALESNKDIPFDVKRVYYVYGTHPEAVRGLHAHRELKQVAIAIHGSCRFILDDGATREDVVLNKPDEGLLIDSCLWREMHDFSHDCVLVVLASEHYMESDYIRNYDDFVKEVK
ncbi:sugar 3,4-ketoisomerase [Vibrio tarriae]|uniref:dTDP-6-deoxy-3,4-keto-hexulose isomerase n=1 Tax=Vibrio tarriae TaxID=2014742 RepID=A0AAU8WKU8_9VIBR|nr:FdtA/QdtA family cupin domain-containing protein [Vibrio tarriae]ASK56524.1 dTDP-6-deoxy-3,4-keto-hexulose isomerase [Vibrio tarriae]RBM36751.1 WxcM-like domain-containing protein [Vibrio tarriae]